MAYLVSFFSDLMLILVILLTTYVFYMKYKFQYWNRHNIPQLNPSIPFGNIKKAILKQESNATVYQKIHQKFKAMNAPFGGTYFLYKPVLFVIDVDLIKQILVKDFQYFNDRGVFNDENDPLTSNLFSLEWKKWKCLRIKFTPTFTSGKMKMMFNTLVACSDELNNILADVHSKSEAVNIKDILSRFTTDVIGSCAFGIDCNSLKDPNTDFRKYGQLTLEPKRFIDKVKLTFSFLVPNFFRYFNIKVLNENLSNFFINVVKTTVKYREDNNIKRDDLLHLLIQLKNHGELKDNTDNIFEESKVNEKGGITIEQIAAQCFVFFIAGFDTSSTTMTFCLYELVKNLEIQEKLREEIETVLNKYDGKLTYEAIMEMHYMDKVICETLRKYPPLPVLARTCSRDYRLPKSNYMVPKGCMIRISILGLHKDPEYYPDPEKFDPERFSPKEKAKRPACTFIPFGEGPRNCIGMRFGLMQTKVGLSVILKNYRFTLNKKTPDPLLMDPNNCLMSTKGGIWLNAHKV